MGTISEGPKEPHSSEDRSPWSDPRLVIEGRTADDWRRVVADRHADHTGWEEHLREAERCMRASGVWPWPSEDAEGSSHGV